VRALCCLQDPEAEVLEAESVDRGEWVVLVSLGICRYCRWSWIIAKDRRRRREVRK